MDLLIHNIGILAFISLASTAIVKWLPNSSFNIPGNFKDGKLPCSKKTVVFPQSISGSVGLESVLDIGAIVLPDDGEIVLENAVISLGQDIGDSNCTDGNSYYLDKAISSWTQADVWSSSRFNEATPDSEKVPCFNDVVEFPANFKYTVRLPDEGQSVRELRINNESLSTTGFENYVKTQTDQMGQFVLNSFFQTGLTVEYKTCQESAGCPCQKYPPQIDCSVKFCPEPNCVTPIKPSGYCCSFCGGHITFEIDEGFDMISFKELVDKIIDGYGNAIAYHIGFVSVSPLRKIQLVIVDKGEYSGNSVEAIAAIDKNMHSRWYKGEKLAQISGSPLYNRYIGAKLFVSTFFAVVIVLGVVYVYYYRPNAVWSPRDFGLSSRGHFFRFQGRSDSVVSLTRRDSSVMPMPRTAFRNPLYDSKRGRVQVEETVVEES